MERRQKYSNSVRESKSREMSSSPSFSSFSSRGGRGAFETGPQPPVRPWRTDLEQTGTALPACRTRFRFPRAAAAELVGGEVVHVKGEVAPGAGAGVAVFIGGNGGGAGGGEASRRGGARRGARTTRGR